ncbi:MAG: hypothetical protein KR126chlam6_01148 [Candidatus Anoxychlamydiales bacterium]|nr:hypothetical protein [Candidatus Anoxychlamydiales bacterium]
MNLLQSLEKKSSDVKHLDIDKRNLRKSKAGIRRMKNEVQNQSNIKTAQSSMSTNAQHSPEYIQLKENCRLIIMRLVQQYGSDVRRSNLPGLYITQYLNSIGSPAAMQLLKDLQDCNFQF